MPHVVRRTAQRRAWMKRKFGSSLLAAMSLWASASLASPLAESDVPAPLKPWIGWVLHDHDERRCPLSPDSRRLCTWPAELSLALSASGGKFTLNAETFAPGW